MTAEEKVEAATEYIYRLANTINLIVLAYQGDIAKVPAEVTIVGKTLGEILSILQPEKWEEASRAAASIDRNDPKEVFNALV